MMEQNDNGDLVCCDCGKVVLKRFDLLAQPAWISGYISEHVCKPLNKEDVDNG